MTLVDWPERSPRISTVARDAAKTSVRGCRWSPASRRWRRAWPPARAPGARPEAQDPPTVTPLAWACWISMVKMTDMTAHGTQLLARRRPCGRGSRRARPRTRRIRSREADRRARSRAAPSRPPRAARWPSRDRNEQERRATRKARWKQTIQNVSRTTSRQKRPTVSSSRWAHQMTDQRRPCRNAERHEQHAAPIARART